MAPFDVYENLSKTTKKLLKKPIGTLMHFREEIISSLDFAVTGV